MLFSLTCTFFKFINTYFIIFYIHADDNTFAVYVDGKLVVNNVVISVRGGVNLTFECSVTDDALDASTRLDFGGDDIVTDMMALRSFTVDTIVTCTGSNDLGSASFSIMIAVGKRIVFRQL